MKIQCENAAALVPSYLDGELSEEQAAPLRRHLLECHPCREVAQDEQSLKRWFVDEPVTAPSGFAARIARRAFAGDPGLLSDERVDAGARRSLGESTLAFVLQLTALAAAALLVLALSIRERRLPEEPELSAETYPQVLEELEELNREESQVQLVVEPAE